MIEFFAKVVYLQNFVHKDIVFTDLYSLLSACTLHMSIKGATG